MSSQESQVGSSPSFWARCKEEWDQDFDRYHQMVVRAIDHSEDVDLSWSKSRNEHRQRLTVHDLALVLFAVETNETTEHTILTNTRNRPNGKTKRYYKKIPRQRFGLSRLRASATRI